MRKAILLGLALTATMVFANTAIANNLVQNGSFETGDFTGWTVIDQGSGHFTVESGTTAPNGSEIPPPPDGTFASIASQEGPGTHILYQDVTLPMRDDLNLTFLLYYDNTAEVWYDSGSLAYDGEANQHLRIDIMDPSADPHDVGDGVLKNILKTGGEDPFKWGYGEINADLSEFAGQTIRIRFAEVDNQFFFNVGIDSVAIYVEESVPVNQPMALILLVLGMLGIGAFSLNRARLSI